MEMESRDSLMLGVEMTMPRRTYVGVLQAVLQAWGDRIDWWDDYEGWDHAPHQAYNLIPTKVTDSARYLAPDCFERANHGHVCLSFHSAKQLPLGRGGAILTEFGEAADWFRAARMDGRPPGAPIDATIFPAWHMPMPPDTAARGLDILSRWNDAGYSPPPLPPTDYPDLSLIHKSHQDPPPPPEPKRRLAPERMP